jgi:hypothetical protein
VVEKVVVVDEGAQEVNGTLVNPPLATCAAAHNPCGTRSKKDKNATTIRGTAHPQQKCYSKNPTQFQYLWICLSL